MNDGLATLNLSLFDMPKPAPASTDLTDDNLPLLTRIKKTRSGKDILVCSVHPIPDEVLKSAEKQGLAVFSPVEIETMRNCHPALVDRILEVKIVFPGASVESVIQEEGC